MQHYRREEEAVTVETLTRPEWRLDVKSGPLVAPRMRLRPDGGFVGHRHWNEWRWAVDEGALTFFSSAGIRTVIFDQVSRENNTMTLSGSSRVDPQNTLVLSELPATAGIAPAPHEIGLTGHRGPARRRNLVIVRADENSLHPQWDRNIPDLERNWDVCVSFYGKDEDFSRADFVQYHVHQHEKRKYPSIFELLTADRLWDYDFFMIIDDDVMLSWLDLNVAFEVCREHRLDLAQPSLTPDSFWSHALTVQQPGLLLRFVGYVEGMAAIFSKEALRTCLPTFERSQFGWGIDVLWPLLLGRSDSRVAVIDRVAIRHTRPVGATYDGGVAKVEGDRFLEEYGCRTRYIELGSLRGSTIAWGSPQVGP